MEDGLSSPWKICSTEARWPLAFGLAAGASMDRHLGRGGGAGAAGSPMDFDTCFPVIQPGLLQSIVCKL